MVEALVAGMVLALSGTVLSLGVRQGMRMLSTAAEYETAAELLDRTLTRIDLVGPAALREEGPTSGAFPPPRGRFRWRAEIAPAGAGHLYDVTVTVLWTTPAGAEQSATVQTRLHDPPREVPRQLAWEDL